MKTNLQCNILIHQEKLETYTMKVVKQQNNFIINKKYIKNKEVKRHTGRKMYE